jgi:hypothetical protein
MEKYFKIINISSWEYIREGKGYSESYWFVNPESRRKALFKLPRYNEYYNIYYGEHWAEKIISEIGKRLNLSMPDVELAEYNSKKGCLSFNFLKRRETLKEGVEILNVEVTKNKRDEYTLKNILESINEYNIKKDFIRLLLFDAFVGQSDRHEENWGIISSQSKAAKEYYLAPIYDNASALGRNLIPKKIEKMLIDRNYFNHYIKDCQSSIKLAINSNPSQIDMLYYLYNNYENIYKDFLFELNQIDNKVFSEIIERIPNGFMAEIYKIIALKILIKRKEIFINIAEKEENKNGNCKT